MNAMITTMMGAARTTTRLASNARVLPRLALRATVLSMRHIPPPVTVRRFSIANPTQWWFSPLGTSPTHDIGPSSEETKQMLAVLGYDSMEAFVKDTIPGPIRIDAEAVGEHSIPALSKGEMLRYAEKASRENGGKRWFGSARYPGLLKVLFDELSRDLCTITGFAAASLQLNSGAASECTGISIIRAYHASRGDSHRDICLVSTNRHGTNPNPAVMAGMKVVLVGNLPNGYLDLDDLRRKAKKYRDRLGAFMITCPSTYGIFEPRLQEACQIIHENAGQVYLDDANLNGQIGLTSPAKYGGDVCRLNLHKTFTIPHEGEGLGAGAICVASHLVPFLPSQPIVPAGESTPIEAIASAPYGSALTLLISWAYIRMLGGRGLADASKLALLNANYVAHRLRRHYSLKHTNDKGLIAHGLLIDWEELGRKTGLGITDIVERLQDYGFYSSTSISTAILVGLSKGNSMQEIDQFCDAMIWIRKEAEDTVAGAQTGENGFMTNASHRRPIIASSEASWNRRYPHELAAPRFGFPRLKWRRPWPVASRAGGVRECVHPMISKAKLPWTAMGLFISIRAAAKTCIKSSAASTMLALPRPPDMEKLSGSEVDDESDSMDDSSRDEDSRYDEDSCNNDWPIYIDID